MISLASSSFASVKRAISALRSSSTVDLAHDRVDARDVGDRVRDQAAAHDVREGLQVHEAGPADVHAVRPGRAIADDVAAELTPRRFDRDVHLAFGDLEALGEDLEVVDEGLHRLVDAGPRWRGDLLVLDPVVAGRHAVE